MPPIESPKVRSLGRRACLIAALALTACGALPPSPALEPDGASGAAFSGAVVVITTATGSTVRFRVEVADTGQTRAVGLADRTSLSPGAGMLLLRAAPDMTPIWMKDVPISLTAAWFDEDGRITWIEDLEPCRAEPCELYAAPTPALGVLEVNRGALRDWGIAIGDELEVVTP